MRVALAVILLFPAAGALSVYAQPLPLREAVDAALASEPRLRAARAERDVAAAARREARTALDPQVTLSASAIRHDEPMVVSPIHGFTPDLIPQFDRTLIQSSISAGWLLWDGGGARARIDQAAAVEEGAEAGMEETRERVIQRTVAAYFSALSARDQMVAHDRRLDALQSELERVALLRQVGRAAEVEILRVEAARAAAEAERTEAAALLEVALGDLARITGLADTRVAEETLVPIMAAAGEYDFAALQSAALEANVVVRQAARQVESRRAALAATRAGNRPQVQLAGALLEYGSGEGDFTFEWNAGVLLRMPLYDRSVDERIARARAELALAEARLEIARDRLRGEIDRAVADWRRAVANLESLVRAERSFAEVVRIEKLRLDSGVGTQNDYLLAQADLLGARAALAVARQRLALALVELARLTGDLTPDHLEIVLQESP